MHRGFKAFFILILIAIVMTTSGCVNLDPESMALANPMIQEFLEEHPNAEIVVTHLTKEQAEYYVESIRSECGNPGFEAKELYRINIMDPDTGFYSLVWLDWESKLIECAVKYGTETEVSSPPKPGCRSHSKSECYKEHVYWFDSCGHVEEKKQYCEKGCENGFCREKECKSKYDTICHEGHVFWIDSCGNRGEKKEYCKHGCKEGACIESECESHAGTVCHEGHVFWVNSCGTVGEKKEYCEKKCENGSCITNYCGDGVCNGDETSLTCKEDCNSSCIDYDKGKNYYEKSAVSVKEYYPTGTHSYGNYYDICESSTVLKEWYCYGVNAVSIKYTCPGGCIGGACIESECESHADTICHDGHVYWIDSCGNKEDKKEYCSYGCEAGECISTEKSCTDYDEGKNYHVKSYAVEKKYYTNGTHYLTDYHDECMSDTVLREIYCSGTSAASYQYTCPNGCHEGVCVESNCTSHADTVCHEGDAYWIDSCENKEERKDDCLHGCEAGACIGSCNDTDGGYALLTKGTVSGYLSNGSYYSYTDFCDEDVLTEFKCIENEPESEQFNCTGDSNCTEGACVIEIKKLFQIPTAGAFCENGNVSVYVMNTGLEALNCTTDFLIATVEGETVPVSEFDCDQIPISTTFKLLGNYDCGDTVNGCGSGYVTVRIGTVDMVETEELYC